MSLYTKRPNLMIGFHGCDELIRNQLVVNPDKVRKSEEIFDWLGHGFYIWENNYERALKWAEDKKARGKVKIPSVVGVIYQLEYCLDFTDSAFTDIISTYYPLMKDYSSFIGKELPKNEDLPKDNHHDLVLRKLDCAVIEYLHQQIDEQIKKDIAQN
jgi:hypothetical protein